MAENTEKVFAALSENPELMEQLLAAKQEGPTRAMPGQDPVSEILQGILGQGADVSAASEAVDANGLMQLYLGAGGDIDAKELMDYVGGFSGTKADKDPSVRALLDGKLDFKEILMLIAILKLLKGKKKPQQQTSGGLIGSLLGANQQPQNSALDLFSSLLGAQSSQPAYSQSLFGNLFGAQPAQSNPQVFAFGTPNTGSGMNILQSLLGGNTGITAGNSQAQQIYSLLNGNTNNAFNSNGSINVGTLFSLASQLMGIR